jgi:hypothetical protein
MQDAIKDTRADTRDRYRKNVQTWLDFKAQSTVLSEAEIQTVNTSWLESIRTDECATIIHTQRQMAGLWRP